MRQGRGGGDICRGQDNAPRHREDIHEHQGHQGEEQGYRCRELPLSQRRLVADQTV